MEKICLVVGHTRFSHVRVLLCVALRLSCCYWICCCLPPASQTTPRQFVGISSRTWACTKITYMMNDEADDPSSSRSHWFSFRFSITKPFRFKVTCIHRFLFGAVSVCVCFFHAFTHVQRVDGSHLTSSILSSTTPVLSFRITVAFTFSVSPLAAYPRVCS